MMASAAKRTAPAHGTYLRRAAPRCRTRLAAERDVLFQIPCRRLGHRLDAFGNLLIHESPLTDALFLLVSKSDEVTTT